MEKRNSRMGILKNLTKRWEYTNLPVWVLQRPRIWSNAFEEVKGEVKGIPVKISALMEEKNS